MTCVYGDFDVMQWEQQGNVSFHPIEYVDS
jgi:hypothetical protein